MELNHKNKIIGWIALIMVSAMSFAGISSCGKAAASAAGLNIKYEILNLSPDLGPIDLFVKFQQVNTLQNPFIFNVNHGYFYVPAVDTPYQIRSDSTAGRNLFSRDDILKQNATYSLFITGNVGNNSLKQIFTVDTATSPASGRGKIRFVDASPTGTSGLDLTANGTTAFTKIIYPNYTPYIEVPVGLYDFQVSTTGSTTVLKDVPNITIQDGRLYTIYAYGYSTRIDSAAFSAGVITNR